MCGIVGSFGPSAVSHLPNLGSAVRSIAHRGPDGSGTYVSPCSNFVVGHVRLAIQDVSQASAQPMSSGVGVLSYNGELYNHLELRQAQLNGVTFRSHGDTETLLKGLDQYGLEFFKFLVGMFAGAYFRPKLKSLLLFRDPLAIKPFYYRNLSDSTVVFASEIKGLFALVPELPRRVDQRALQSYLAFENLPSDCTLFQGVKLLHPGHALELTLKSDGTVVTRDIQLPTFESTNERMPIEDLSGTVASLRQEIAGSVSRHLLSDRPVGVYLSGGIDSSLVASMAAEKNSEIAAFTGFFEEESDPHYDERPLARLVARRAKLKEHHEVPIRPEHFREHFDTLVKSLDEPRMGMGSFSQFVVAKEAGKYRRVILAGHGGDELFAGYPMFRLFLALDPNVSSVHRFKTLLKMRSKEWPLFAYGLLRRVVTGGLQFAPILDRRLLNGQSEHDPFHAFSSPNLKSPLSELEFYYKNVYLPGLLLVEDKVSMAHALETRLPLWSQRLVDLVSQIAPSKKLLRGELKGLLKEVARPYLPAEIFSAPKRGFPTPLRNWFRQSLSQEVRSRLLDSRVFSSATRVGIESLLKSHSRIHVPFALDERRAHQIWMLLCLESWSRQYEVPLESL